MKSLFLLVGVIPIFMLLVPSVYAGGFRYNYDESLSNGTDTSDDIDTVCSGDRPYQQDLVDRSYCNDNYYCKNYYGNNESSAQDLLLRTWCD